MKNPVRYLVCVIFAIFLFSCTSQTRETDQSNYEILKDGFTTPPAGAHPKVYWWWLNGHVDTVRIKEELLAMKNAGVSGVDIFEIGVPASDRMIPPGPAFMGAESLQTIKFAIQEAGKLDIDVGLNVASSWNAGGSWTLPKNAAKSLYSSMITLKGGQERIHTNLPFPEISKVDSRGNQLIPVGGNGKPLYYEEVTVLGIPAHVEKNTLDTARIINLSEFFDVRNSILDCQLPEGEWEIYRYVCSNSGEPLMLPSANSHGPIIDHFDSVATETHFMFFINTLKPLLGDFSKTALKSFYLASYEARGSVWTSSLPAEFRKRIGYDIYKFIPGLANSELFNKETTERIQSDFRKILSELMVHNFYRKAKEVANRHDLKINSEAGGPGLPVHNVPSEPLKALGSLDIPRGEFWLNNVRYDKDSIINVLQVVKEVSAASHIYGRKIVEEEAFTNREHWQLGPFDLKPLGDRAFCEGMNKVVVHGFSHNPAGTGFPGYVYHAGTHFNDKAVWWSKIKPFNEYLARVSYILQETDFFSDVLFYYGDKLPIVVGPKNAKFNVGPGYDYEMINSEILLNDLAVQDGQLILPAGQKFSILALATEGEINADVLVKLQDLATQGAIITGIKPGNTAGLNDRIKSKNDGAELLDQLWTTVGKDPEFKNFRAGKILSGLSSLQILQSLSIPPDFDYPDNEISVLDFNKMSILDYIHYKKENVDFYFIRNTTDKWVSRYCTFRQTDKIPEIWNPVSGEIISIPIYDEKTDHVEIPLTLAPYASMFVVFRNGPARSHFLSVTSPANDPPLIEFTPDGICFLEPGTFELKNSDKSEQAVSKPQIQKVEGAWDVSFPKGWGAPESVTFPELISWSRFENKGVQYFSGTATYTKTFQFDAKQSKDQRVFLDLGDLSKVGEVWLNNQRLGITWTKPFKFDVTDVLKTGDNIIKIEIANNWSNRLTGDGLMGEKYTNTNLTMFRKLPWAEVPLLESGLLGPVTVQTLKVISPQSTDDGPQ